MVKPKDPIFNDPMESVKRLLILQMYRSGISTKDIGNVLGVSYKTIERMVPIQKITNPKRKL